MDFKENTKKLLNDLKKIGLSRRQIEREMGYDEKYIDQVLSRGGNEKFLNALNTYVVAKNNLSVNKKSPIQVSEIEGKTLEAIARIEARQIVHESYLAEIFSKVSGLPATKILKDMQRAGNEEVHRLLAGLE